MKTQAASIKSYLLQYIPQYPKTIVSVAMKKFGVSRTTIHRHLNTLLKEKKLVKSGTTQQISYFLIEEKNKNFKFSINSKLSESHIWETYIATLFTNFSTNIRRILQYGFTEIFNNAIDHSEGKSIEVSILWFDDHLSLQIQDNGIGVFERIKKTFHYEDPKECLLHLSKGRLTTDPLRHSGEGLFFTSRAFDKFYLDANRLRFYKDNLLEDWTVEEIKNFKGSCITMVLDLKNSKNINDLFNKYTDLEDFNFCKTEILVNLSLLGDENLISRSQAKRTLERLESFTDITLDFSKIASVGQGFVDEVFRVYKLQHPHVTFHYINANNAVEFMIKRGLTFSKK